MNARLHLAAFALAAALVLLGLVYVDLPLARWFKQYDETALRRIFGFVTQFGEATWYLIASFTLFAGFQLRHRRKGPAAGGPDGGPDGGIDRRRASQALFVFLVVVAATLPVNLLKILIGRARPRLLFREDLHGFFPVRFDYDYWSLPSGHSATIVALTMALYFLWPRYWPLYLTVAALVCASRVIITTHYFADVVAGIYVAAVGATIVHHYFARRYPEIFDRGDGGHAAPAAR